MLVSLLLLFSCPAMSDSLQSHGLQHARPLCPSPSPEICPSSCPSHRWCHPAVSLLVSWSHCSAQNMPCKLWFAFQFEKTKPPDTQSSVISGIPELTISGLLACWEMLGSQIVDNIANLLEKNILKNEPQCNIMYCHWHCQKKKNHHEGYKWFKT